MRCYHLFTILFDNGAFVTRNLLPSVIRGLAPALLVFPAASSAGALISRQKQAVADVGRAIRHTVYTVRQMLFGFALSYETACQTISEAMMKRICGVCGRPTRAEKEKPLFVAEARFRHSIVGTYRGTFAERQSLWYI